MDLSPEERDKIYLEEKARLEARHSLELEMKEKAESSDSNKESRIRRSALSSRLSYVGVTLIILGVSLLAYFGCMFSVSVPVDMPAVSQQIVPSSSIPTSVNNIGLISDRENGLIFGGLSLVIGAALLITGLVLGINAVSIKTRIGAYTLVVAIIAIVILLILPTSKTSKRSSAVDRAETALHVGPDPNDPVAKERLMKLGLAIVNFGQSHYAKLPNFDTSDDVKAEISQYGLNDSGSETFLDPDVFIDPSSNQPWTFNSKFSGLNSLPDSNDGEAEIIAYSPQPTGNGCRWCLNLVGVAKKLSKEQWDATVTTTKVKFDPQDGLPEGYTLVPQ